jgi:hypothetical protein
MNHAAFFRKLQDLIQLTALAGDTPVGRAHELKVATVDCEV